MLKNRVICKLIAGADWDINVKIDFALAFWMVHEVPDKATFVKSVYRSLKSGGKFLIAEPFVHVTKKSLENTMHICENEGFVLVDKPKIFFSNAILLEKK